MHQHEIMARGALTIHGRKTASKVLIKQFTRQDLPALCFKPIHLVILHSVGLLFAVKSLKINIRVSGDVFEEKS